jgi:hypothetical protein
VHFVNKVDEADLIALMEETETAEETTIMPQSCICTDKCEAGSVNESCPVCLNNLSACTGKEIVQEESTEPETEQPAGKSPLKSICLLFLLTLFAGGGAFYYFKFIKPKDTTKGSTDFSDFDFEDEDEETEYEDETDTEAPEDADTGETDPAEENV